MVWLNFDKKPEAPIRKTHLFSSFQLLLFVDRQDYQNNSFYSPNNLHPTQSIPLFYKLISTFYTVRSLFKQFLACNGVEIGIVKTLVMNMRLFPCLDAPTSSEVYIPAALGPSSAARSALRNMIKVALEKTKTAR